MTKQEINNHRETVNFYRSEVMYLTNRGNEKEQGRDFARKLGQLTERIETEIGFNPSKAEQDLFDWAFGNWRTANDKFK